MKWMILVLSIACEVLGTTCLKLAGDQPEKRTLWITGVILFYAVCFALLGLAMKHFSLSVVYATWSGVGVALLAMIGVVFFKDPVNLLKIVSFILIVAGIVGLNLSGTSH